ncbi:MAG: MBL fold metallo-hydrolase [Anaerolineae bacterium]
MASNPQSKSVHGISRRTLLKGFGISAGALAAGFAPRPLVARAQSTGTSAAVAGLSRFSVGDIAVTIIQDAGFFQPFSPTFLGINASLADITAIAEANNLPVGVLYGGFNIVLLEIGEQRVLLDTGNGIASQADGGGKLFPTLELLGITPEDINAIIFSHYHPDHINGAVNEGALVFPNAVHHFPQPEYDFLRNATNIPADFQPLVDAANSLLDMAEATEQLSLFAADGEVISGVTAIPTPGHTPGHVAMLVSSGDAQLLNTFDAAITSVYSVERPDFVFGYDADPQLAVESRMSVLGRAADEGIQLLGYHFPFPGVGYIVREGDGFEFVAAV